MTLLDFTTPHLDYLNLAPFLIVLGTGCAGILLEAFLPRRIRFTVQAVLAGLGLAAALAVLIWHWGSKGQGLADPWTGSVVTGTVIIDGPAQAMWAIIFTFGLISVIFFAERRLHAGATAFTPSAAAIPGSIAESEAAQAGLTHSEVFPLAMFSMAGMALFVSANDLLVLFVGLEILSLPLYVMSGLARHRRLVSQEAALKYFLLGGAASAIFLFGVGCLFGFSGSFDYENLAMAVSSFAGSDALLLAGLGLVMVGLLFKIGAVPFHSWVPDVYQGAPTPVTAFMSVCTKVAAVGGLLRLLYVGLGPFRWTWQPVVAGVAVLTIVVGTIIAINQTDIKRVLAYSSVAHAGFVLVPVAAAAAVQSGVVSSVTSVPSILFYLIAYGFATIGCFAVITLVRSQDHEATSLAAWSGIGRRNPLIGFLMVIFLLSLAGIPLTAGFVGKLSIFLAAWQGGYGWLVVVAIAGSLVAVYIYIRVIQVMFFRAPADAADVSEDQLEDPQDRMVPGATDVDVVTPGGATWIVLIVCALGTIGLGIVPGPLLDLLQSVASFMIPAGV